MRTITKLLAAGVVAAAVSMSAQATVISVTSQAYGFTTFTPGTSLALDFDAASGGPNGAATGLPAGFTLTGTGYTIQGQPNNGNGAAPATSPTMADQTKYLSVYNGNASLGLDNLYKIVSLYWGSIDNYNSVELFNGATSVGVVTNATFGVLGTGNQQSGDTNRRVDITTDVGFNRIVFTSGTPAFEIDNIALGTGAVPEAATWMMMLAGFGVMGYAMRRRPRTAVTFG